ncbi:MAG: hypothetical protein R3E66_19960 [bacterium]
MKVLWPMLGVLVSTQALAATPVVETESAQLEVGGYVSATNGVQHRFFDIPTLPRTSGVSAGLLASSGSLGDSVSRRAQPVLLSCDDVVGRRYSGWFGLDHRSRTHA